MLIELSARHWVSLHGLAVFLGLAVYAIASHTLRQRRHPSAAMAWIISLIVLPYVTLPLFLMIGNRKLAGHSAAKNSKYASAAAPEGGEPAAIIEQLAAAIGIPGAADRKSVV